MAPKKRIKKPPIDNSRLIWTKWARPKTATEEIDDQAMLERFASPKIGNAPPVGSGWILDAEWKNSSGVPILSIEANWKVPAEPAHGFQLFYVFIGLKDAVNRNLLQCCLQWGSNQFGGGQQWSIGNVQVANKVGNCPNGLDSVTTGDTISASISFATSSGGQYYYQLNINGQPAMLSAGVPLLSTCCIALETYGISDEAQLPPGSTFVQNIKITTSNGVVSPVWFDNSGDNPNGQHLGLVNGNTVELCYHKAQTAAQAFV